MPINEYGCNDCRLIWEVTELSLDDVPHCCPECGSRDIKSFISWKGMYAGEHRKAFDRPPPSNPTSVFVTSNKPKKPATRKTKPVANRKKK